MYVYCTHITVRYLLSYSDKIWYAKFNEKSSKIKQNVNIIISFYKTWP